MQSRQCVTVSSVTPECDWRVLLLVTVQSDLIYNVQDRCAKDIECISYKWICIAASFSQVTDALERYKFNLEWKTKCICGSLGLW